MADDDLSPDTKLTRSKRRWAEKGRFLTGRVDRPQSARLPPGQHLVLKSALNLYCARKLPEYLTFTTETTFRLSTDTYVEPDSFFYPQAAGWKGLAARETGRRGRRYEPELRPGARKADLTPSSASPSLGSSMP